jgi:hypothetical protein
MASMNYFDFKREKDGGGFEGSFNSAPHIFDYNKNRKFS